MQWFARIDWCIFDDVRLHPSFTLSYHDLFRLRTIHDFFLQARDIVKRKMLELCSSIWSAPVRILWTQFSGNRMSVSARVMAYISLRSSSLLCEYSSKFQAFPEDIVKTLSFLTTCWQLLGLWIAGWEIEWWLWMMQWGVAVRYINCRYLKAKF